jgi:hypothetical protein
MSVCFLPGENYAQKIVMTSFIASAFILFYGSVNLSSAQVVPPLSIKIEPETLTINQEQTIMVKVVLTNNGDLPIESLDIQIVSPGFKTTSKKNWSSVIYPNSTISGQYLLESITDGKFPITASASYLTKNSASIPPEIKQLQSTFTSPDITVTGKADSPIGWASIGEGTISTAIGVGLGLIVPKLADAISNIGSEARERQQRFERLKGLLLYELGSNYKNIERLEHAEIERWRKIADENIFYLLSENPDLETNLMNLYADLGRYNRMDQNVKNGLKPALLEAITQIITALRSWKIT